MMESKGMTKKELNLGEMDKISGGSRAPGSEELAELMEASKEFQKKILELDEARSKQLQEIREREKKKVPDPFF